MLHGRADAPVSVTVHSIDAMTSMKASSSKQFGRRMQDPSSRTNQRLVGIVEEEFRQKRLEPSSFAVAEEVSRRNVREVLELCNDFEGVGQGQGFSTFLGRARGLDILYNRPPPIVQATQDDESDSDVDEAEVLDHINAHDDFHVAVHPHLHHRTAQQLETINRVRTALERNSYFSHIEEQFGGCIDKLARCDGVSFKHVKAGTVFFRQKDCGTNCYVILSGEVGVFKFNEDRDADVKEKPSPRCADVNVIPERQQKHDQGKDSPMKGRSFAQIKGSISADQLKGVDMPKERFRTLEGINTYNDDSLLGGCVTTLGEGVHFGELALLKDAPRAATIKCTKDCEVLVIRRSPFQVSFTSRIIQRDILSCAKVSASWSLTCTLSSAARLSSVDLQDPVTILRIYLLQSLWKASLGKLSAPDHRPVLLGVLEVRSQWARKQPPTVAHRQFGISLDQVMFSALSASFHSQASRSPSELWLQKIALFTMPVLMISSICLCSRRKYSNSWLFGPWPDGCGESRRLLHVAMNMHLEACPMAMQTLKLNLSLN